MSSVDVPVALLGYGTVGSAVNRLLVQNADEIERATGHRLRVVRALVRDPAAERSFLPDPSILTTDFRAIADDPEVRLVAVAQDASGRARELALAYGTAIGAGRAGMLETTFLEETETDLFGEQAVLCGGVTELVRLGFETLVEAGYQPEIAYYECLHELKLIVDLIYEGGLAGMRYSVSDTAEYGDLTRGPKVIDDHVRENMRRLLADIREGGFAREWIGEMEAGEPHLAELRDRAAGERIETVGAELRALMHREAASCSRPHRRPACSSASRRASARRSR